MEDSAIAIKTSLLDLMNKRLPEHLTMRQIAVFLIVSTEQGPHRVRHLAERMAVQKPIITRATRRLARLGWITRHVDKSDARDVLFTTTKAGALALAQIRSEAA